MMSSTLRFEIRSLGTEVRSLIGKLWSQVWDSALTARALQRRGTAAEIGVVVIAHGRGRNAALSWRATRRWRWVPAIRAELIDVVL